MSSTSVTVVGGITRDTIFRPGNSIVHGLGGALYNIVALAALSPDTRVVPVANVGEDIFDEVVHILSNFPNVDLIGLRRVKQRNIHPHLFFVGEYGVEWDEGEIVPITYSQAKAFLDASFVLVTFPTGFDLRLRTLRRLAAETTGLVYLDYHILTRARDEAGVRYLRRRRNWREWVTVANFVQFNRFEAGHVAGQPMQMVDDIRSFGQSLLGQKVRSVIVTCGADGSFLIYGNPQNPKCLHMPPEPVETVVNTTGCGCVYAAGFVTGYLQSGDMEAAARFATCAAAQRCTVPDVQSLRTALQMLQLQRVSGSATS